MSGGKEKKLGERIKKKKWETKIEKKRQRDSDR